MKKIILAVCCLFMLQSLVFADEIIDAKGTIIPCRIETVCDGFVEYKKDGNLYTFTREEASPVFNDYVDIRLKLLKKEPTARYSGKIIIKDMWGVIIRNENGNIDIPWYKIQFVGVYKPK